MIVDYFRIGLKNISRRKLRSWLTMLGIVVGIASVIALIGLGNGLRTAITGQFGGVSADILTIQASGIAFAGPPGTGAINRLDSGLVEKIASIPEIDFAASRLIRGASTEFNNRLSISGIASVPDGSIGRELLRILDLKARDGRLLRDGDGKSVVIGSNYQKPDNGYGKAINPGDKMLINGVRFTVVGIIEPQGSFLIDNIILMYEEEMNDLLGIEDETDIIVARVKSLDDIDRAKEKVERLLRKERGVKEGEEDFTVDTAQSVIQSINNILGGVQAFVIIIASISMIVGAIGIINTMFTAVLERRKEIGIMKSIGGRNSDIFSLFLIESGLLGTVGGLVGILLGQLAVFGGIKGLELGLGVTIQYEVNIVLLIGTLIGSFLLGALSGVIPAVQAAKLNPVDALRH